MGKVSVTFEMPSNFTLDEKGAFMRYCRRKKTFSKVKLQMNIVISVNEKSTMNSTETLRKSEKEKEFIFERKSV
ncbi:hypothetical protein MXB_1270 [Myxobolus squamalis]|nr:hypothetical protein MXB_1270 [Myxobolus squamalis]